MMKQLHIIACVFIFSCLIVLTIKCVVIGSNTTPSRQGLASFTGSPNTMLGFASFESGFTLANATTSCTYDDFFPIGGTSTFNGGDLILLRDLSFTSTAIIVNGGTITGNGLYVQLPSTNGTFSLNGMIFSATTVICGSNINLNGNMVFNGVCTLDCNNKTITTVGTNALVVGAGGSLLVKNGTLQSISTGNMYCTDSLGTFSFSNMTIIQDAAYSFTQGRIVVIESLIMTGSTIFAYQSSGTSSIQSESTWYFDTGMTFSYAPSSSSRSLISMTDATSVLFFESTNLFSTTTGLQLTKGTLTIDGTCNVNSQATVLAQAISLGDGVTSADDLTIQIYAGSGFNVTSGILAYNNVGG